MSIGWNEEIKKKFKYCGENVFIGHNTIFVNPDKVIIHDNVRIDPFCYISSQLEVGSFSRITTHCVLSGRQKIKMGKWSVIAYGTKLFTSSEDYTGNFGPINEFWGKNKVFEEDIEIKDFAGVITNVTVLPGVIVPEGCMVGTNGYLTKNKKLEPWSIYIDTDVHFLKHRNKESILKNVKDLSFYKDVALIKDDSLIYE